jgi:hypothetical protein
VPLSEHRQSNVSSKTTKPEDSAEHKNSVSSLASVLSPIVRSRVKSNSSVKSKQNINNTSDVNNFVRSGTPWYLGYNNQTDPTGDRPFAIIPRYGAQGTIQMLSYDCQSIPAKQCQNLDFLNKPSTVNEYSTALKKESPSLWPGDSAYVSGTKLVFRNTRGATASSGVTFSTPGLTTYDERVLRADEVYQAGITELGVCYKDEKQEMNRQLTSLKKRTAIIAQNRLQTIQDFFPPVSTNKAVNLKSLLSCSIIHASSSSISSVLTRNEMDSKSLIEFQMRRFQLRWKYIRVFNTVMQRQRFHQPLKHNLDRIMKLGIDLSLNNLHPFELTRLQFSDLILSEYPDMISQECGRLYSSFDPGRSDSIDIRDLIATLRALRVPNPSKGILLDLFDTYDVNQEGELYLYLIKKIFNVFADSTQDEELMNSLIHSALVDLSQEECEDAYSSMTRGTSLFKDHDRISLSKFKELINNSAPLLHTFGTMVKVQKRNFANGQ